jgi:glutathionylspermidine synthase
MGNKALLPYVYKYNKYNKNLIPSSFNPNDKIFEKDEYIIEKGIKGRGSKLTKKIKKTDIKNNKKENVIYQKIFDKNLKKIITILWVLMLLEINFQVFLLNKVIK